MDELQAQAEPRAEELGDCRPSFFLKQSKVISVTSKGFTQILRIAIFFFLQEEQLVQKQTVQNSQSRHHGLMSQKHQGQLCLRHPLSMFPRSLCPHPGPYQQVSRIQDITLTPALGSVFQPSIFSVPANPPLFHFRREITVNENFQSVWTKRISLACFLKEIVFISSIPKYFLVQLHLFLLMRELCLLSLLHVQLKFILSVVWG